MSEHQIFWKPPVFECLKSIIVRNQTLYLVTRVVFVCTWRCFGFESELITQNSPHIRLSEGWLFGGPVTRRDSEPDFGFGAKVEGPIAKARITVHLTGGQVKLAP